MRHGALRKHEPLAWKVVLVTQGHKLSTLGGLLRVADMCPVDGDAEQVSFCPL